jgi:hypothetical protein
MTYFEVNTERNLIIFKNTSSLADLISELIDSIRLYATKIDKEIGAYVKLKTPGKTKVKLGIRFALRNNAFNYKRFKFEYQGRLGIVSRPLNTRLNRKIREGARKLANDTAEVAVRLLFSELMKREGVSDFADQAAKYLAKAVMIIITDDSNPPTMEDLLEVAAFARSTAGAAGRAISAMGAIPAGSFVEHDAERHLIKFKNTAELAKCINTAIKELRDFAGTVPQIGPSLKTEITKQTPGPRAVRLAIYQGLKDNAFNYQTGEFQSEGWSIGTTRLVNHFANKRIKSFLVFSELAEKCIAAYVSKEYLKQLPKGEFRELIAARFAARILELVYVSE